MCEEGDMAPVIIPATAGWWLVYKLDEETKSILDGKKISKALWERVLAWKISEDGWKVEAITVPESGGYTEPEVTNWRPEAGQEKQFIYGPDLPETYRIAGWPDTTAPI